MTSAPAMMFATSGTLSTSRARCCGFNRSIVFTGTKIPATAVTSKSARVSARRVTTLRSSCYPGKRIAFQSDRERDLALFWQPADGTGAAERLTKPEQGESHVPESWSPDGKRLLFTIAKESPSTPSLSSPGGSRFRFSLWMLSLDDRKIARFSDVQSVDPIGAVFSPDGRWIAYSSNDVTNLPNRGVYVQPFPAAGARYQTPKLANASERGYHPMWAASGRELFDIPVAGQLVGVNVTTQPSFTFETPAMISQAFVAGSRSTDARNYDVLPGGRFLGLVTGASAEEVPTPEIRVVLNWFEELKRRVPTP